MPEILGKHNYQTAYLLHQQCHSNPWSEAAFLDCLQHRYFGLQIKTDDKVVSYCIGLNVVGEITLMDIGVDQRYRGYGYGSTMLSHFLTKSRSIGGEEVWLEVRQHNNRAINLYQSNGFELIETRENYYNMPSTSGLEADAKEDALVMKKHL